VNGLQRRQKALTFKHEWKAKQRPRNPCPTVASDPLPLSIIAGNSNNSVHFGDGERLQTETKNFICFCGGPPPAAEQPGRQRLLDAGHTWPLVFSGPDACPWPRALADTGTAALGLWDENSLTSRLMLSMMIDKPLEAAFIDKRLKLMVMHNRH
jgi:hypothetical protein